MTDGIKYVGILDEKKREIRQAVALKGASFVEWLKLINIDQCITLSLSANASYTAKTFDLEDRERLEYLVLKLKHAKKYCSEYMENKVFQGLLD